MGQQQLLLIVLGVIIVGIAIVVGINLFNANAETSTQDSIVSQGTNLGAMAQQYFKKPVALGGGGNSFVDGPNGTTFENYFNGLPSNLISSTDATWEVDVADTAVVLTAIPTDPAYAANWTVETVVYPTTISSRVKLTTP
ncbi:MAG TPA: hypothetical protein PKD03_10520 [Ignavibacteriaceae bacterium]|nr:hypothetical protein [Ignavibacteriaceae bacterium]